MSPRKFLKKNGISITACAATIGCSRGWLNSAVNGQGCSKRLALAFERFTNGKVNRLQLLYPDEFFEENPFNSISPLSESKTACT